MHVLVVGGAGFIGSTVVDELLKDGFRVTVLDSLVKGHREAVRAEASFVQGDAGDAALLDRIFSTSRVDAVMHFAAFIEAGESMKAPERFFENNTARTLVLLDRMLAHDVKKFIFSSTAAVYGDPQYTPIDEAHPKAPTSAYGASKLHVELALDWLNRLRGLGCVSLRYFNAAGCGPDLGEDHAPETHLIPLLLDVALGKREKLFLFGRDYPTPDGTCVRDYIHIQDLAQAHIQALKALKEGERRTYNLGNGKGFSNLEVVETARRVTGHPILVEDAPRRSGDPATLIASSDLARKELGWEPRFPDLETIVQSAWAWRQRHPQGYGQV